MVQTASDMLPLGTRAPDFRLPDVVSGREVSLDGQPAGRPLLVMFICNHCPYVVHVRDEFTRLQDDYGDRLAIVAINSNDVEAHPDDGPEHMRELAEKLGWRFPFLFDESQEVAKAYHAACTPDFFLFSTDFERRLQYRGQLDGSRPGNSVPVTGSDLRTAIDALLCAHKVSDDQRPSMGCNIKWRPGNEPDYFGN
jgi:thiol-disulfide isomerase/thioredoxin